MSVHIELVAVNSGLRDASLDILWDALNIMVYY